MRKFVLTLLVACVAFLAKAEPDWRFAHPQAEILVGVSTNTLLQSPWADVVQKHFEAHGLPDPVKIAEALDEVQGVYLSSLGQDGLMLLSGNFEGGRTMEFLREKGFEPRFLTRTLILLGDEGDMDIAAARMKDDALRTAHRKGEFVNPLFYRAKDMAKEFDCWMVGVLAPALVKEMPAPFRDVRSFSYGLNLDEMTELKVTLNSRSRDGVERLTSLLERFRENGAPELDVKPLGTSVAVTLRLPDEGLETKLGAITAAWTRVTDSKPLLAAATPEKPKAPEPPPPPARKTVLIFGVDGGKREHGLQ